MFEFDGSSGDALDEDGASIVHAATAVHEPMKARLLYSILEGIDLDKGESSSCFEVPIVFDVVAVVVVSAATRREDNTSKKLAASAMAIHLLTR